MTILTLKNFTIELRNCFLKLFNVDLCIKRSFYPRTKWKQKTVIEKAPSY